MFWIQKYSKHSWNNFHMKTHVLNTFSISRCSGRSDVPNVLGTISIWKLTLWTFFPFQDVLKEVMFQTPLEQFQYEKSRFEHFFHFKKFRKKWCSKRLWNNFNLKIHVLNTFSISRCPERSDVPITLLGTISMWKLPFWTLVPFQDVLKKVMFQTPLEQIPCENLRFEHFFHFKMFWKRWCPEHSWYNFHMKTHVLIFFFYFKNVLNPLGTISKWKTHVLNSFSFQNVLTEVMFKTHLEQFPNENSRFEFFFISKCSDRSDVQNTLGTISMWKLTFWTFFPFQDILKDEMSQTLLEETPFENFTFWTLFLPFQDVLKKVMFQTLLEQFPHENSRFEHLFHFKMIWKKWCSKRSWNNFHQEIHVLHSFPISRCFERSDIPDTLGTISTWKLTFWILFSFQMFWKKWCSTPSWNNFRMKTHVLIFFSFQDILKEVILKKPSWNNFQMKTHVLNFSFISRCSERSYVQNIFGTISTWKLTFWTLSISRCSERSDVPNTFGTISTWKLSFWTLFFIPRCSERSDVQNPLGTISKWKLTFWTHFPFQDVLEEVTFQTPLQQIPRENSRFEHFFHFKMFWKKWCPTHFSNTYDVKTLFWAVFPCQDVLTEVMFQALWLQFSRENSRFEHFFEFKMFWKK